MHYTLTRLTREVSLADGQLLLHRECGVAKFRGIKLFKFSLGQKAVLILEFANGELKYLSFAEAKWLDVIEIDNPELSVPQLDSLGSSPRAWADFVAEHPVALVMDIDEKQPPRLLGRRAVKEGVRHEVWRRDRGAA